MTRRSVLLLPASYPRPESPVDSIFVQDQAVCLARSFEVHVLAPRLVGARDAWKGGFGPRLTVERDAGVTVWRPRHVQVCPNCFRLGPFRERRSPAEIFASWYEAAVERGFQQFLKEYGRPDLIHAHVVLPAGWVAAKLGKRYDIPVVVTEHSGPFSVHMQTSWQRQRVQETLTGVERVLAVSPALARIMNEFWPAVPIEVLGNVVRTGFFTPSLPSPPRGKVVFFLTALLVEPKGVKYVLQALHTLLRRKLTDVELVIGGDGPHRSALELLARQLGLGAHCRFLGMLDRAGVREQMRQCDVFVLPSLGETFGLVLGEAMACGKPVISTRCGGPEFVVAPDTGILVTPAEVGELADAMARFVLEGSSFDAGVIRASVTRRFGEEVFVSSLTQVYETIWESRQRVKTRQGRQVRTPPETRKPLADATGAEAPTGEGARILNCP